MINNQLSQSSSEVSEPGGYAYISPLKITYFRPWKRLLDVLLVVLSLPLHIPVAIIIALLIRLTSRGPVIFKQKRTGLFGKEFFCYKFRTMHVDRVLNKKDHPPVTKKSDNRITWVGKILRKTNLDELPQLMNVLLGDMSLVGPRPYMVEEHNYWSRLIPGFNTRTLVKPGLSGYAQVTGYRGGTLDLNAMNERFEKDMAYIRGYSIKLDVYIIWATIRQMITGKTNAH